jgi:hypothetical protein
MAEPGPPEHDDEEAGTFMDWVAIVQAEWR